MTRIQFLNEKSTNQRGMVVQSDLEYFAFFDFQRNFKIYLVLVQCYELFLQINKRCLSSSKNPQARGPEDI